MALGISPTEQKVYKEFYRFKVVTVADVSGFLGNYRKAVLALNGLAEKKYAKKVKRGLYAFVPFENAPDSQDAFVPEKILVANKFAKNSFLSHHTALEVYGAADREMYNAFITTRNRVPSLVFKGVKYVCIKSLHHFGFAEIDYHDARITVSEKERTVLDCLRNINYTYGFDEIKRAILTLGPLDFEKMYAYLKKINEISLFSRTGYTFSSMKAEANVPDWFIDKCKSSLTNRTYYLDITKKGSSKHVKEWKLMVPV
jgi:predicted transcriptional regulator of viral defense system